jgi:DNA polymerase
MARDAADIVAARRRLTLRAEQAFGAKAVLGNFDAPPRAAQEPAASSAKSAVEAAPPANLFGVEEKAGVAPPAAPFTSEPLPPAERSERLRVLDETQVKGCTKCPLHETRTQTVFGEGDPAARLVFIGEGPGQNEDETGRPFVGRAGDLLNKMIVAMGLRREDVFIANVVKCRPPNNRQPTAAETAACTPYLVEQMETIRPKVIVTLGLPASQFMLGSKLPMAKLRGQWHDWRAIKLMPTYHPAYLLRAYTTANRRKVWEDLQQVAQELGLTPPAGKG